MCLARPKFPQSAMASERWVQQVGGLLGASSNLAAGWHCVMAHEPAVRFFLNFLLFIIQLFSNNDVQKGFERSKTIAGFGFSGTEARPVSNAVQKLFGGVRNLFDGVTKCQIRDLNAFLRRWFYKVGVGFTFVGLETQLKWKGE